MKLNIIFEPPSVTVITPTIGSDKLMNALLSVSKQTYSKVKHLVVVDGEEYRHSFDFRYELIKTPADIVYLPNNTGANGFNGQRIYAAFSHLIDTDYIFFLDEDNWFEPNHVESLLETLQSQSLDFAYSLRNIYERTDNGGVRFVCQDNCESLGKWPIWFTHDNPQYLIDTSSFAFKKDFLRESGHLWHTGPWGEDRRYLHAVRDQCKWNTSGMYTLNYRLDGNPKSVNADFFIEGNEKQKERYGETFPWTL
jgi:glycosyltransferase involved in cell wall biosynthesis